MIRDDGQRGLLFDLDGAIQDAGQQLGAGHGVVVRLTATYHNLLRRWAHPSAPAPKASRESLMRRAALAEGGLRRHPRSGEPPPCPCLPLAHTSQNCV